MKDNIFKKLSKLSAAGAIIASATCGASEIDFNRNDVPVSDKIEQAELKAEYLFLKKDNAIDDSIVPTAWGNLWMNNWSDWNNWRNWNNWQNFGNWGNW